MNSIWKTALSKALFGFLSIGTACGNHQSEKGTNEDFASSIEETSATTEEESVQPAEEAKEEIPVGARVLIAAYPDWVTGYENGNLLFSDGTTMIYDDGKEKDFEYMLDNSSPKDMFYTTYPEIDSLGEPKYLADAGRSRNEALFKKMYGKSAAEVGSKLVKVDWFGGPVKFTSVNGASEQLKKVYAELQNHPELHKYLKSSGTFYWRNVRGANRLSAHSYGMAFDIGVDHSDYWLWKNPKATETTKIFYSNKIPHEIVKIFEKYGFIWGGGWYHFDTMHFEYRPEILLYREEAKKIKN